MDVFSYPHREGARKTMEIILGVLDGEEDPGIERMLLVTDDSNFINNKFQNDYKLSLSNIYDQPPEGDISVEAVTGTAMLIDREKLKEIEDWDTKIFNYFEDMDLCLRLRFKGYEIIKIRDAEVDHDPFASHDNNFEEKMNFSRNWHYSWSSLYFLKKHTNFFTAFFHGIKILFGSSLKFLIYLAFNKKKSITHFAKAYGMLFSILNIKPSYRPKIKI